MVFQITYLAHTVPLEFLGVLRNSVSGGVSVNRVTRDHPGGDRRFGRIQKYYINDNL